MAETQWALVVGAGSGLGQSVLRRFASAGMTAVGLSRSVQTFESADFRLVDVSDPEAAAAVYAELINQYGAPNIVVHNVAELVIAPYCETSLALHQRAWQSMVQSMVVLAHATFEPMVENGGGTVIVSGATASVRAGANFSAFASAKFALRGMTQSLAREFQPRGLHIAHVLLDGIIDTPRSRDLHDLDPQLMMNPDDIAEAYWQLARQPTSTWTHELDLRPFPERF